MGKPLEGLCSISTTELKALSVPTSLLFLLGVEYDIFVCATSAGLSSPFKLHFPTAFTPSYRMLLDECAHRFGLTCRHEGEESVVECVKESHLPLLRYVDYIPGKLHVDEIMSCFGIDGKTLPGKPKAAASGAANEFEAHFIKYTPYASNEALEDVHGAGYYLTLDYGLSLATHGHLVQITFTPAHESHCYRAVHSRPTVGHVRPQMSSEVEPAVSSFRDFSGWKRFDLRFDDETKRSGVIVLPSVQDASDLMERYEDEESDNEADDYHDDTTATIAQFRLPFHIQPVAPTTSVPYMEDSALRKTRASHWTKVEQMWEVCAANRYTLIVANLFDGVTLDDVVKLFDGKTIDYVALVEDESPAQRRRVFVTFSNAAGAHDALGMDGRNMRGKALRIFVAPPHVDEARRGKVLARRGVSVPGSPQPLKAPTPSPKTDAQTPSMELNIGAKEFVPRFTMTPGQTAAVPPPYLASPSSAAPPPPYLPSPSTEGDLTTDKPGLSPPTYALPPPYVKGMQTYSAPPPGYQAPPIYDKK